MNTTLYKQIAILVTITFIILLFTILTVSLNIIRDFVQKELYENAQNTVSSLSLSISNTNTSQGNIETMINAIFDNGNYERITYKNLNEEIQYQREFEEKQNKIPSFLEKTIQIQIPIAKATISSNWQIIGVIEILNSKSTAYNQLYNMMINMLLYLSIACMLFLVILNYVFHIILKPLRKIENQVILAMKNEFVIQSKLPKTKEFRILVSSINSMIKKFESIFKTANETLSLNKELLYIDSSTNLYNRRYFILKAGEYLDNENEKNKGISIIVSIKKLELLNKTFGYKNTDKFIYEFAQYIKSLTKNVDDALVCRLNGTEIVIILPKITIEISSAFAKDIILYVDNKLDELELSKNDFGIYLAISQYKNLQNISELFGLVDYSLVQSKLLPYGEYYVLTNNDITIGKDNWRENILNGVKNDELEIIYKQIIDLDSKQKIYNIVSFNLNTKIQSYPYETLIAPVIELGMIQVVYLHIIRKVLISNNHKDDIPLIIQLSLLFLNDLNAYEKLKQLFKDIKKQIKCKVIFEIPEVLINKHYENSLLYINLFKEYGFDFGTNSFIADNKDYSYLKELQPKFVKANKQYLLDTQQNVNMLKIILKSLNIELIVTEVNSINELNKLEKIDIKLITGELIENLKPN